MSFNEAVALQPQWVQYWLYWLSFGGFVLPIILLFWRKSRKAAAFTLLAILMSAFAVSWIYSQLGYVKLLGLGHLIFWTPAVWFLMTEIKNGQVPPWPRRLMMVTAATLAISLAFDLADALRYLLGERTALPGSI
jgi:hypothetical protein